MARQRGSDRTVAANSRFLTTRAASHFGEKVRVTDDAVRRAMPDPAKV